MTDKKNSQNACVGIVAIISGISIAMVTLIGIFAPQQLSVAAWIMTPLCLMGLGLGHLSVKAGM
ncbi:hypothetical protein [Pelagicoccus albus]|uniref:Uncharacterized protein n=1 Tax=Pelagicoccus albus TaxID=415222 RepID=A0A7X1E9L0_9BACT|nr:hypothetical protein [Pelagicoccus albus]MBC2607534.1 hypothetical protein [Pelagicoccus albus]